MGRYLISIFSVLLIPTSLAAQIGTPPFASFSNNQFAAINNGNLNTIFAIPIVSSPGRGISLNLSAAYNSQVWAPILNGAQAVQWTQLGGWNFSLTGGGGFYLEYDVVGTCDRQGDLTDTTYLQNYVYTDPLGTHHPFPISVTEEYSSCTDTTTYSGTYSGYATDNSGYYASIADPSVSINPLITTKSGISVTTNGTMIVTDTNGNILSGSVHNSETDWTDSAGRVALKIIPSSSSTQYQFLDPSGNYRTTTAYFTAANIKTNFGCSGVLEYSAAGSLLTSIALPNGQTYSFTYEPTPGNPGYYTGRIQKVTLPSGGTYEYDYLGPNDGTSCSDGSTLQMNQVVSDGTNSATWSYVRNGGTTTITTPQLADTPNAFDTVYSFTGSQATQVKIYKESPGVNVLRTINNTWASNGTPATQVTILEDGSTQSEVDTTYDSNGLLDSVSEYDWGTGGRGSLLRTTTYTYQTSPNYTGLNIIDLVISKQIKDASGTVQYRQDITYDATSGDNQSCPTGIAQHNDSSYGCSFYYRGNPTSVTTYLTPGTPANGITKNFTYDFFGNLRSAQLNCCQNKTWGYSSASTTQNYSLPNSVTSGSSPSLTTTYAYYLPTGQVNTATDANGLVNTASYDYLRRPTQVSETGGASASMSYDDTNFITTTTVSVDSSKSVKQVSSFDKLGRPYLTTTNDASNNVYSKVSAQYDLAGRSYQTSNPYTGASPSYWTSTAFDVLGRPTSVTLPDNSATTYSYTTNTATVTDPTGIKRESVSDAAGRLSTLWEPDPNNGNSLTLSTSYVYNVLNELTQITQGSQARTYVYDALGRLNSATTPEAGMVCFGTLSGSTCQSNGYDSFDNLLYRTDARGVVTSYGYDTLNRLTSVSYNVSGATGVPATPSLGFTYGIDSSCNSTHGAGCIGQLITMTDGVGSENYTYNSLEQLTQLQKTINGSIYTTSYVYNLAGQLTQLTYPSGRVVQQSVDAVGRLCEVAPSTTGCGTAASPFATGLGYNTAGEMTGLQYGNGIYASFGFTADRLQLNCLDYSTTNRNGTCAHDGTTKFGLSYSYPAAPRNNGLISSISDSVDSGRSATYAFDSLYRLTSAATAGSANYPAWGLSETYDRYGNRSAQTAISGCVAPMTCPQPSVTISTTTNRLVGSPYAYDSSGNMTNDGINTLVYDAESHAVSATSGSGAGAYVYDGNGLRIQKCEPSCGGSNPNTVYVFSGSKVIAEYDNGAAVGSPSREYIYAGGALLAKIDSGGTKYYHQDHLSNRLVTDSSGNKFAEMGTFPYGESWYNASNDKLLFTTYERDSESGNDYGQARYHVSGLGRFSSPDAIAGSTSDPQSLNRYSYVRNMPVMLTDPFGTCPGGVAQNHDSNQSQSQDSRSGGPSNSDSDAADPQGIGSSIPPGPCRGFTDQGGGSGGISIDGGEPAGPDSGMGDGGFPVAGGDTWALDSMHTWLPGFGDEGWGEMDLGTALFLPVLSGQSAGGGGGGAGGVDAKALGICTKLLFGVSLESFTAAQGGLPGTASNGSFIGVMAGVYQGFGKPPAPGPSEFTVVADVSLDQHGVTAAWNFSLADYNLKYGTQYPQAGSDIIAGFTNPLKPFSNHVASNSSNILGTQIYELGNSLSFISSQQMENPGEFGMQYEAGLKLFNCYKFLESN